MKITRITTNAIDSNDKGRDLIVSHAYDDVQNDARPSLRLSEVTWSHADGRPHANL